MKVPLAHFVRGGMTRTIVCVKMGKQMGGGKKVP